MECAGFPLSVRPRPPPPPPGSPLGSPRASLLFRVVCSLILYAHIPSVRRFLTLSRFPGLRSVPGYTYPSSGGALFCFVLAS